MGTVIWRTLVCYLALIASVRLMGKRQVGQMEPSEFVVTMLMADIATIPVANQDESIFIGLLPIGLVVAAELVLSLLSNTSVGMRWLLCGKPMILIENGHILQRNLRRARISADELTGHLRLKDVLELSTVQYAILETNGSLSVFLYPPHQPLTPRLSKIPTQRQYLPVTVIEDGTLMKKNLRYAKKDQSWVDRVLKSHNATVEDTFLLTVDGADHIVWLPKE